MAAHILCHSNEVLPNTFPPPRPTLKDHGMMSEYEAPIVMQQSIPYPEVDRGLELTFEEEFPTFVPQAAPTFDLSEFYDPALCVTPEKGKTGSLKTKTAKLNRGSDEGLSSKPQHSQKVRFENFIEVKEMSPNNRTSLEGQSSAVDFGDSKSFDDDEELGSGSKTYGYSTLTGGDESQDVKLVSIMASDMKLDEVTKPKSKARTKPKRNMTNSVPKVISTDTFEAPEHVLARPEFNSTLRVGRELQQLSESELNVQAAIKQKMETSNKTKAVISEKSTSKVNQNNDLFEGLVSLELQEQDLIESVAKEKGSRAKPAVSTKGRKAEDNIVSPPDILDCLTPDLMRETASCTLDGIPPCDNNPATIPLSRAFDVFRHIRTWENW